MLKPSKRAIAPIQIEDKQPSGSNHRYIYPLAYALVLVAGLLPYYSQGHLILGGEGNYNLNFSEHLISTSHQWFSRFGFGMPNLAPSGTGTNILFLVLVENLTGSIRITNFTLVFLIFYLPFLGMYLVATELKTSSRIAFLVALFYAINPACIQFLTTLNQWNAFAATAMPMLFWIIVRYYHDNLKLFCYYGLTTTLLSFAYTNQPLNAIVNISSMLSVYIVGYYYNQKVIIREIAGKFILTLLAFIIFNAWWLINMFHSVLDAISVYSISFAQSWLEQFVSATGSPIGKSWTLNHLTQVSDWDFHSALFTSWPALILTLIPIIMVITIIFFTPRTSLTRFTLHLLSITLIALFLTKGASPPFGEIYLYLFHELPFFYMFKSPVEKFGLLYAFLFTLLLLFVLNSIKSSQINKKVMVAMTLYLALCSLPIITGNVVPAGNLKGVGLAFRKYKESPSYHALREGINKEKLIYRNLSLPGMGNYQVLFVTDPDADTVAPGRHTVYTGMDPILMNTNKSFLAAHLGGDSVLNIYRNILTDEGNTLLGLYSIGKLVVNSDLIPWFGFSGSPNAKKLNDFLLKQMPSRKYGNLTTYSNLANFIPIISSPKKLLLIQN